MQPTKSVFVSLLTALVISANCISAAKPIMKGLVWRSNPAYSKQLDAKAKVENFYVSPPTGFMLRHKTIQSDTEIANQYSWTGPIRADGTQPRFTVVVHRMQPGVVDNESAKKMLKERLDSTNTAEKHYLHTNIQNGKIGGMNFVRAYWKRNPNDTDSGKRFRGFQYISSQGRTVISIVGDDVEAHYKSTLDLLEAAALTFHRP